MVQRIVIVGKQVFQQNGQGPAVQDGMVVGEGQLTARIAEAGQQHPPQRRLFEVKTGTSFLFASLFEQFIGLQSGAAQINDREGECGCGLDYAAQYSVGREAKCGAQCLVALHAVRPRSAQTALVDRSVQPCADLLRVGGFDLSVIRVVI